MAETFTARSGSKPLIAAIPMLLAALLFIAAPAHAQSLDAARASGLVGERYDGVLVIRQANAPAAVRTLVDNVNKQRREIYAKRAAEQKIPAAEIGRLYANQIVDTAPKGTWFLLENGQWKQK